VAEAQGKKSMTIAEFLRYTDKSKDDKTERQTTGKNKNDRTQTISIIAIACS